MSEFMIVWLNQTQVDFAVSLSKVDNHCGIIRSAKGDSRNKGIRFDKDDFLKAFAILKPDEKLPQMVLAKFHFKIAPTPLGSTQEQVRTWITAQGWEAKPLRPLSGSCWLCVAEKKFDVIFAQWNSSPVLVRWLEEKKEHAPIILAGDIQRKSLPMASAPARGSTDVADNMDDPWGAWISNHGGTGISIAGALGKTASVAQPPRKLESPIEDRFARHDGALQDLKQHADQEISSLKESLAKLERNVEIQNVNIQSNMEQTNAEFRALRTDTANQLHAMTGAFTESLRTTIAAQESQMSSQFAELKDMIMHRVTSKTSSSPPQKKPKNATGNGNDSDL